MSNEIEKMKQRWYFFLWLLFSCLVVVQLLCPHGLQHSRLPCPSLSPRVCSNVYWIGDAIQPSHPLLPHFPALNLSQHQDLFPMSRLFAQDMEGGQSIGASASVLPMNIQEWLLLELTGLISLLSRKLSRVFSSTTIQNLKLLGSQPSLWPICTWLLQQQYLSLWGPLLEKWFIYFLICYLGLAQLFFQGASVF